MAGKSRKLVIIPAGGSGSRMALGFPKQLMVLDGQTVIEKAVLCFQDWADEVWVAVPEAFFEEFDNVIGNTARLVVGGATRFDSVRAAFSAIPRLSDDDLVLIHDAARPFFSSQDLDQACALASQHGAVIYATPVTDTVKQVDEQGRIEKTLDRSRIFLAQTPQIFRAHVLKKAYASKNKSSPPPTDEAALVEDAGFSVMVFPSSKNNIKLTQKEDLALIPLQPRIGHGYDVHAFQNDRPLFLCGIQIPEGPGLAGHSDADVALHALMDALLGAVGLGDIGHWFPDQDPAFKNIRSTKLLRDVWQKVTARGYDLENADVTIQAQTPRLAPHIDAMREKISCILAVDRGRINVKATTTEGLGFVGQKQGIAVHAVVLIQQRKGVSP